MLERTTTSGTLELWMALGLTVMIANPVFADSSQAGWSPAATRPAGTAGSMPSAFLHLGASTVPIDVFVSGGTMIQDTLGHDHYTASRIINRSTATVNRLEHAFWGEIVADPPTAMARGINIRSGVVARAMIPSTNSQRVGSLFGLDASGIQNGTGTASAISAVSGIGRIYNTGTVTSLRSGQFYNENLLGGTATTSVAVHARRPIGRKSGLPASTWGTIYGAWIDDQNPSGASNTLTNPPVALRLDEQTATGAWAMQSAGGQSYHAGKLRLGSTTAPAEALDVTGNALISGTLGLIGAAMLADEITTYNNIATVSNGVPAVYGEVNATAQAAAITDGALYKPPTAGMYRVSFAITLTRAATESSNVGAGVNLNYTPGDGSSISTISQAIAMYAPATTTSAVDTGSSTNTVGSTLIGSVTVYADTAAMTYNVGYTSRGATAMQYAVRARVERL